MELGHPVQLQSSSWRSWQLESYRTYLKISTLLNCDQDYVISTIKEGSVRRSFHPQLHQRSNASPPLIFIKKTSTSLSGFSTLKITFRPMQPPASPSYPSASPTVPNSSSIDAPTCTSPAFAIVGPLLPYLLSSSPSASPPFIIPKPRGSTSPWTPPPTESLRVSWNC